MPVQSNVYVLDANIDWEKADEGVKRKILGYDKNIMMVKVDFLKGAIGYVHKHPHTQVSYVASGKFEIQIGSEKKILSEGDCYFIPSNIEHGAVNLVPGVLIDVFSPMREDFLK